jgi:hypothetical protein
MRHRGCEGVWRQRRRGGRGRRRGYIGWRVVIRCQRCRTAANSSGQASQSDHQPSIHVCPLSLNRSLTRIDCRQAAKLSPTAALEMAMRSIWLHRARPWVENRGSTDQVAYSPRRASSASRWALSVCATCGGSLIAMSRHHGRRRGLLAGFACPTSNGGPNGTRSSLQNSSTRFLLCASACRPLHRLTVTHARD